MKNIFLTICLLLFLLGCNSASPISANLIYGTWQLYIVDDGRSSQAKKLPIQLTFSEDWSYISYLDEGQFSEKHEGSWQIKNNRLILTDHQNNISEYLYNSQTSILTHSPKKYDKTFFPGGVTLILEKVTIEKDDFI